MESTLKTITVNRLLVPLLPANGTDDQIKPRYEEIRRIKRRLEMTKQRKKFCDWCGISITYLSIYTRIRGLGNACGTCYKNYKKSDAPRLWALMNKRVRSG